MGFALLLPFAIGLWFVDATLLSTHHAKQRPEKYHVADATIPAKKGLGRVPLASSPEPAGQSPSEKGNGIERHGQRQRLGSEIEEQELQLRSMWRQIRELLRSRTFCSCTLSLCALYFVVTGVQFWATEFFTAVVGAKYKTVLVSFAATSATAPVLGVVVGGLAVDSFGGYKGAFGMWRTFA